jgi:cation diffusion facilitator CzcD-associated flavoprotein CzcO
MFTVGDLKWASRKPRDYRPGRDEVRDHLASSIDAVRKTVSLSTRYGHTVTSCEEIETSQGHHARLTMQPNGRPEQIAVIEASRAIVAPGLNYRPAAPLAFSSDNVQSIIPQNLSKTLKAHPGAPVCVVGGGKTGMDTVLAVLAENAQREVSLIDGRGTIFFNRTKFLPTGMKRWISGKLISRIFRETALSFDGDNEGRALRHFRIHYSTAPDHDDGSRRVFRITWSMLGIRRRERR